MYYKSERASWLLAPLNLIVRDALNISKKVSRRNLKVKRCVMVMTPMTPEEVEVIGDKILHRQPVPELRAKVAKLSALIDTKAIADPQVDAYVASELSRLQRAPFEAYRRLVEKRTG